MKKDGGPAFPSHGSMGEIVQPGMTLRAYFAGQALSGVLHIEHTIAKAHGEVLSGLTYRVARSCLEIADALIAELELE